MTSIKRLPAIMLLLLVFAPMVGAIDKTGANLLEYYGVDGQGAVTFAQNFVVDTEEYSGGRVLFTNMVIDGTTFSQLGFGNNLAGTTANFEEITGHNMRVTVSGGIDGVMSETTIYIPEAAQPPIVTGAASSEWLASVLTVRVNTYPSTVNIIYSMASPGGGGGGTTTEPVIPVVDVEPVLVILPGGFAFMVPGWILANIQLIGVVIAGVVLYLATRPRESKRSKTRREISKKWKKLTERMDWD